MLLRVQSRPGSRLDAKKLWQRCAGVSLRNRPRAKGTESTSFAQVPRFQAVTTSDKGMQHCPRPARFRSYDPRYSSCTRARPATAAAKEEREAAAMEAHAASGAPVWWQRELTACTR